MKSLLLLAIPAGLVHAQTSPLQTLHNAEMRGDSKTVESLLSSGFVDLLLVWHADPNAPMTGGNRRSLTPLQYAAEHGDLPVARALIAAGAKVNDPGGAGRTPLHFAAHHLDMARFLIGKGADVNARDAEGASPLDDAVWNGNLDAATMLIANGARLNDPDTETGATPLNEAAFRGHTALVRYLLGFHPDVTIADKHGRTALANAIRMKKEDCALLLLDAQPVAERTPRFLGETMEAAITADLAPVAESLLGQGVNANEGLPSGYMPLDAAAFGGAAQTARMLLAHGADPNTMGKDGSTPLEDTAAKGFDSIAAALLDGGARVNQTNQTTGTTALHSAVSAGHLTTVKLLLDRGADPSLCGVYRRTPYQIALADGHTDIAAEIRKRGGSDRCE